MELKKDGKKIIKNLKENKILKAIYNILYMLLVILVVIILIAVILQRASKNTLSLGGFRIFNIITGSMIPKYEVGDVLISKTIKPEDIKVGDDIVYFGTEDDFAGKIVTHQVIDIEKQDGKYVFHTKGLANTAEDPLVKEEQISGKIIYKIKTISYISKLINNLYSFYFVIFIPVVILIFIEIRGIIVGKKESKEEEKDEKRNDDEEN